ncbi:oligosaccharide flippase family protein [Zobellia galactanivorans]|uniref:lipopolysaccharide biosynthesis protein n=1 Tax=Zobellia galactanivorans (strain DSM 12802 / CCUG 47099 / CIP 106680 / NCIMB 13871 / Dsij) TaxID=63186 RepID=UPI0026E2008E|nr:oligosaccharide flippase family protein [Zobellia galactanivorans]MDO6809167.1 oligosaccharide flippase family protein [Zobellia galactanivorans]
MAKKFTFKSEFVKNVATVMTGTALSQVVALGATPILTRFYAPRDFGFLVIYLSMLSVVGTISTGKFERAILLVSKKGTINRIVFLSFAISLVVSFFLFFLLVVLKDFLLRTLDFSVEFYTWLFTLPILIIIYSFYTVFNVILNYQKRFKRLAAAKLIKTISSVSVSLTCILFLNDARGLILAEIIGYILAAVFVVAANLNSFDFGKKVRKDAFQVANRFKDFPLFNVPSDFMNMASNQMPVFFLTTYLGPSVAGFYSLMKRVMDAPVNLFSTSILEVFRQKASEQYIRNGECKMLFIQTAKNLSVMAVIPFTVLFILAPELFSLVFGEEWRLAGEYAKIFSVFYFFKFISSPLTYMFFIAEKQRLNFVIHSYIFCSSLIILNLPRFVKLDDKGMLWFYCINFVLIYLVYFLISYKLASGKINKTARGGNNI